MSANTTVTLASISDRITVINHITGVALVFIVIHTCALVYFIFLHLSKRQKPRDEENPVQPPIISPSRRDGPYGNFHEEPTIPLSTLSRDHRKALPKDPFTNISLSGSAGPSDISSNTRSMSVKAAGKQPTRSLPSPDPRFSQSVGTDYSRGGRGSRFDDRVVGESVHPHNHHIGVSQGSRGLDKYNNFF